MCVCVCVDGCVGAWGTIVCVCVCVDGWVGAWGTIVCVCVCVCAANVRVEVCTWGVRVPLGW